MYEMTKARRKKKELRAEGLIKLTRKLGAKYLYSLTSMVALYHPRLRPMRSDHRSSSFGIHNGSKM